MPPTLPKYDVADVVYLRESAAIGSLEAVKISGIHKSANGWLYTVTAGTVGAVAPPVYGDRISGISGATLYYSEDELITLCDALVLREANALEQFRTARAQRVALCPTVINPTAGTDLDDINK